MFNDSSKIIVWYTSFITDQKLIIFRMYLVPPKDCPFVPHKTIKKHYLGASLGIVLVH